MAFIVSKNERNIGDQKLLEFKCLEQEPQLKITRYTLDNVHKMGKLDEQKHLIM